MRIHRHCITTAKAVALELHLLRSAVTSQDRVVEECDYRVCVTRSVKPWALKNIDLL